MKNKIIYVFLMIRGFMKMKTTQILFLHGYFEALYL